MNSNNPPSASGNSSSATDVADTPKIGFWRRSNLGQDVLLPLGVFILLLIVFRSIVIPFTAIIMNLLSVGSAYGLLVLVFREGYGAEFFGFTQDVIQTWMPLMLFAILFGLSMDYQVFLLLSRIQERYNQTKNNSESVMHGATTTASLITGAAVIMVAAFAAGRMVPLQQFGFGLAVAVLVDATIVCTVFVPSTMQLLGDRNWYLPSFLKWLPEFRIEAGEAREGAPAVGGDD